MGFLRLTLVVIGALLGIGMFFTLFGGIMEGLLEKRWRLAVACFLGMSLFIAVGIAVLQSYSDKDPNANRLCLRGHEEWVTEQRWLMVGKVMMPVESTTKRWACDRWESQ